VYLIGMLESTNQISKEPELDKPQFLLGTVAKVAGISPNLLKAWVSRDPNVIPLGDKDVGGKGKGSSRLFTLRRALNVALTAELTRIGIKASIAGKAARLVTDIDYDLLDTPKSKTQACNFDPLTSETGVIVVFNPSEEIGGFYLTDEEDSIAAIFSNYSVDNENSEFSALCVRYGRVFQRVFKKLAEIEKAREPRLFRATCAPAVSEKETVTARATRKKKS
jgi:hypothetical protein